jgi:hypothetical protein
MPIDFEPVDPARARTLTVAQVQHFNEFGYISPLDGLTRDDAVAARQYFDYVLAQVRAMDDGRNPYSIMGYQNRCRGIYDLALTPLFLDYVEDLLGPDFVMWTSHYLCKEPHDPKRVPWHQDATYWPVRPTRTVTIWLAIDEVTPENGPMRFVPGSHTNGKIDWEVAQGDTALAQEIMDVSTYPDPFDNVLQAGQISIHSSTLIHGSQPNDTDQRRCGLTLRYVPSSCGVKPGAEGTLANAIVCRGNPGAWQVNPRPQGDDVTPIHDAYRD